jgi:hypothetical protein
MFAKTRKSVRLTKLEAARRQLETAIKLYFACDDDVSIHTLAAAAYSVIRDINEHRGGEPMLKDLHLLLEENLAHEFRRYINRPENFLKHADKDPDGAGELEPRWTEVLIWEASRKYCEISGEQNKLLITFILWFVARQPELREEFERNCALEGFTRDKLAILSRLPFNERKRFFAILNWRSVSP